MTSTAEHKGASAQAIRFHYDKGNLFYSLWLDSSLTYSCAFWGDADDLEQAQMRKLDFMATMAGAPGSRAVLDVGCGWGSLLRRLVEHHDVKRAVGLTLSGEQHAWLQQPGNPRIAALLQSWEEHEPSEPYDAIISIGAFEHFAKPGLSASDKIMTYRRFFETCHRWLRDDARMSIQTICLNDRSIGVSRFISGQIFPESDLPFPAEVCQAAEGLFDLILLRNDGDHYERTCKEWLTRLKRNRERACALAGLDVVQRYEKYLGLCSVGFHSRAAGLLRVILRKRGRTESARP